MREKKQFLLVIFTINIIIVLIGLLAVFLYYLYDISVSTMCIYRDYCVYHYKSTELVSLYTLDIGL